MGTKVVLGANTTFDGVDYAPGDTVEVAEDTAQRWIDAGVATLVDEAPAKRGPGRPRKSEA